MAKYIVERSDGTPAHSGPYFVISPTDMFAPEMVAFYLEITTRHGATKEFIDAVTDHLYKIELWQQQNPDKVKYPD